MGYNAWEKNGFPSRFPKNVQEIAQFKFSYNDIYRDGSCLLQTNQNYDVFKTCVTENPGKEKTILLWGDSFAAHLYPGFKKAFGDRYTILQRTANTCPPIIDFQSDIRPYCKEVNTKILEFIEKERPNKVVISAIWTYYDLKKLEESISKLKAVGVESIVLIGPVPQWNEGLPKLLFTHYNKRIPHVIPYRMNYGLNLKFQTIDDMLRQKSADLGITYVSPRDLMCNDDGCITRLGEASDLLVAWDYGHLTKVGSEYLVSKFSGF